jgi:rare lipoprotein A
MRLLPISFLILCTICVGCFSYPKQQSVSPKASSQTSVRKKSEKKATTVFLKQRGAASFYGKRFHGKKTASGELFDQHKFSAAHRTLPFGTKVRVKDVRTGKAVTVHVNDRGPHSSKRIIDVSRAAAIELGMIERGIIQVEIETL